MSYFSQQTYQDFVVASHPKQVVCRTHHPQKQNGLLVDVKSCRLTSLTSGWELPVFAAVDQIKPFTLADIDADFFYVERAKGPLISTLPWTGSRFYARVSVLYMLESKRITYQDIKYSFKASGHLCKDAIAGPMKIMEQAWAHCSQSHFKDGYCGLIGLMGSKQNWVYRSTISSNPDDSSQLDGQVASNDLGGVTQYVSRQLVKESWSMFPIYAFSLCWERTQLAIIADTAIKLGTPRKSLIEYRTDSVYIDDLKLRAHFEEATENGRKMYNVSRIPTPDPPAGFDPESSSIAPSCDMSWNLVLETKGSDIMEKAHEIVIKNGQSLLLLAPGGCGKTTLAKQLVSQLREQGHNVQTCALTHVAAKQIEGCTLSSFCFRHILGGSFSGWLVIDEISTLTISLLNFVATLLRGNVRFILLGDFGS